MPSHAASTESDSPTLAPAEIYQPAPRRRGSAIPTLVWLLLLAAFAAGGFYVGHYVLVDKPDPVNFGTLGGKTTISEAELDNVVATYVVDGEVFEVSAREALGQASSLEGMRNADGSYRMPPTESVIAAARTAILMRDIEARGITATDDEVTSYARDTFGTDDYATLGTSFGLDEQTVRERMRESTLIAKLRAQVVTAASPVPEEPTPPEDGNLEATSPDYAAYIFGLAGGEWDAGKGAWASDDGVFARALKEYDIRNESASYAAAQAAFNVAYQQHGESVRAANTQWTTYVNDQLSKAELAVSSLVS